METNKYINHSTCFNNTGSLKKTYLKEETKDFQSWDWLTAHLLSRNWELCAVCCVLGSAGPGLGLGLVLWLALGLGFAAAELVFRIALARPPPLVAFRAVSSCWRAACACCRSSWSCIWSCWSWEADGPELSWPPAERRTPDNWDRSSGETENSLSEMLILMTQLQPLTLDGVKRGSQCGNRSYKLMTTVLPIFKNKLVKTFIPETRTEQLHCRQSPARRIKRQIGIFRG